MGKIHLTPTERKELIRALKKHYEGLRVQYQDAMAMSCRKNYESIAARMFTTETIITKAGMTR